MSFPSQRSRQASANPCPAPDLLVLGHPSLLGDAVTQALIAAGWRLEISTPDRIPPAMASAAPATVLLLPPPLPPGDAMVSAEDFVSMLDGAFVPLSLAMRDLVARRHDSRHTRIVVLIDAAVAGPAGETPAAAAMGGLLGLARSWALELAPLGDPEEVAQAVAFFLEERSSYITGQTLYVCGGLSLGPIAPAGNYSPAC